MNRRCRFRFHQWRYRPNTSFRPVNLWSGFYGYRECQRCGITKEVLP